MDPTNITMALDVLPMVEDDLSDYCRIHFAAFSGGMGQFFARASGQRDQAFVESQHKALLEDPTTAFMKAVDPETGAIVGCAKYHRYYTVRSEEEVRAAHAAPPPPEGAMPEAWNEFFGWLEEARVKYMTGKACWCKILPFNCTHNYFRANIPVNHSSVGPRNGSSPSPSWSRKRSPTLGL